jgi:hypothetical protein
MKRSRFLLVLALLLTVTGAFAQKIDKRLTNLLEQTASRRAQGLAPLNIQGIKETFSVSFNADGTLKSISAIATLKEGAECPTEQLEEMGIEVRFVVGDMVAMTIPAEQLKALEQVEEFTYVKADEINQVMNDKARKDTGVDFVNTTEAAATHGLPKAYTGSGIVLGIIDTGIDFNHAAFRNADGTTRVKKAIVYDATQEKLFEYTSSTDIAALKSDNANSTHGTHTSATAGGTILGNGMQGMAPETDLVLAGLGTNLSNTNIVDCIGRIFAYADEVNKPAVINISLGNIIGLHDGSDAVSKGIATYTNNGNKPGRAVILSSGNSAANGQSIIKPLYISDTDAQGYQLRTVLGASTLPTETNPKVVYNSNYLFYASDYKDFTAGIALVNLTDGTFKDLDTYTSYKEGTEKVRLFKDEYPTLSGGRAVVYGLYCQMNNVLVNHPNYRLAILVKGSSDGQVVKMICNGDGNAEPCFNAPNTTGYDFPAAGYTLGNGDFALNISICDDAVISVGAYITRNSWTNWKNNTYSYRPSPVTGELQKLGEIADFSSYGLDDKGKPRPTLLAPGMGIVSATNNYCPLYFYANQPGVPDEENGNMPVLFPKVDKFERANWYHVDQGTSMSAPVTTGIVALWMQADPTLTVNRIKEVMQATCVNDIYTTNPSNIPSGNIIQAGSGKIDCLAGLKKILETSGIETVGVDGRREATPATMYSVDAPVFNLKGQRVDKNTRGLVIYKGRVYYNQ